MFHSIRRRLTLTNMAVMLALVFAMSGGAWATTHYVITSTKQIKPSVLKALTGKAGPAGPAGPQGLQGLQGPQGLPGLNGKEGGAGKQGEPGANGQPGARGATGPAGTGPTGPEGAPGPKGADGATGPAGPQGLAGTAGPAGPTGSNGADGATGPAGPMGPQGPTGPSGSAGGTLPSGTTETGTWTADMAGVTFEENVPFAISFPIPLPQKITKVFFFNENETENKLFKASGCGANKEPTAVPDAPAGTLCVYTENEDRPSPELAEFTFWGPEGPETAGVAGTIIKFDLKGTVEKPASMFIHGTWAVTAP